MGGSLKSLVCPSAWEGRGERRRREVVRRVRVRDLADWAREGISSWSLLMGDVAARWERELRTVKD